MTDIMTDSSNELYDTRERLLEKLFVACDDGDCKTVSELIQQGIVDVNGTDQEGGTPLHYASFHGDEDIVKALLDAGAKTNVWTRWGVTPLHYAVHEGHYDVVKMLLAHQTGTIDIQDNLGSTALMDASKRGYVNIVELLIQEGANVDLRDYHGRTVLTIAYEANQREIVQILRGSLIRIPNAPPKMSDCNLCHDAFDVNIGPQYTCKCRFKLVCDNCITVWMDKSHSCPWCREPISSVQYRKYEGKEPPK